MPKEKKPLYSAVVLTDKSHNFLINAFDGIVPDDWKPYAHHMTIIFKDELPENLKKDKGKKVQLTVKKLGVSKDAIAVEVDGYWSNNKIPHITIAVPKGGSPVKSNDIKNWEKLGKTFKLTGEVQEIYN
jgi:hypothetical protein